MRVGTSRMLTSCVPLRMSNVRTSRTTPRSLLYTVIAIDLRFAVSVCAYTVGISGKLSARTIRGRAIRVYFIVQEISNNLEDAGHPEMLRSVPEAEFREEE